MITHDRSNCDMTINRKTCKSSLVNILWLRSGNPDFKRKKNYIEKFKEKLN